MNYIKLYEAYFNGSDSETWELIDYTKYISFDKNHNTIMNYEYDKEIDMFDSIYKLHQKEDGDFDNNQYKLDRSSILDPLRNIVILDIYLVRKRTDIFISAYEDEWYIIRFCKYRRYDDDDYTSVIYYISDGLQGLKDWLDNVLNF